jgi:uncharacterized protein YjbI with pentapeptide repeats
MFADLRGADLRGANLFGVKLAGANLTGAQIGDADFTEADLDGTVFTGVQGRDGAKGLDKAINGERAIR